jgi:hypothetical protein
MKESYPEGVAIHGDPESCADVREDGGEALTGARTGWAIELRKQVPRGADAVNRSGRQHGRARQRELPVGLAQSKTPRTCGNSMHGNREIPWSCVRQRTERTGKSMDVSR